MLIKPIKYLLLLVIILTEITTAQFYFFGRNKVQYDKFEWKVIKTEHFNIYYYDEFEELAEIGADYPEEAFDELKVKFNHIVTYRIPLVFYNTHLHFQQTNITPGFIPEGVGGFFEFLKGRVVIPYLGSIEKFRHVIRHELVHVFMTSKINNIIRNHRITASRNPPLWFIEGLAEYWSYYWDTQAEMVMRDAVLNGFYASLKQLNRIYGTFLMYKEGQNFLEFVAEEYGEEKILLIMENFWRFDKFKDVLQFTLGEHIDEIDNKWTYQVKQRYFPLYSDKTPHSIDSKKLTDFGFNFSPNYYESNSSKYIYFIANRSGYTSVFKLLYDEESDEIIKPEKIIDGERESEYEKFHLLEASIDVSRQGEMAFITKAGATDALHLYSLSDEEITNKFQFYDLINIKSPKFSTDGNLIVFNAIDRKGFSDLHILNARTGELKRLTNDYFEDRDPIFDKEGESIIFASDRTEGIYEKRHNLFKFDLNTKQIDYVTYVDANISRPHFTPDYSDLYFNCDYDGTNNIWKLEKNKSGFSEGMSKYTRFITSVFDFTFIDSTNIITSGFEKFSFQFYEIDLSKLSDSSRQFVSFDFGLPGNTWYAKGINLESVRDRVVYQKEYTLDFAAGQIAAGPTIGFRGGGAFFALSDLLGDDRYLIFVSNTAQVQSEFLESFNLAITKYNAGYRTNYAYGVFHFSGTQYDIRQSDDFFEERIYGGFFSLIYPLSTFQRIEGQVALANSDRRLIFDLTSRKALFLSNSISFVHDNSLWGPTGPLDGSRLRILLGYTSDIKFSNANYYTAVVDYRKYFRLAFRSSLATRASIFINDGKEAQRFIAGGSWDLRGWPRWSVRGEKLWISSIELRYPLIDQFIINFPVFGLGFSSIRGAFFFDVGGAWDEEYRETLGSIGAGIRVNFLNAITFRYDIGKKIEDNFKSFQPKLFYQFFFGWDF